MRKLYVTDAFPPTEADLAAADQAGAVEVVSLGDAGQYPPALVAAGITTLGYHEIADPVAPVPQLVEKRKLKLEMLATPWPPTSPTTTLLAFINAAVAGGSEALQIEWADANEISRTRDLVLNMKAAAEAAAGLSTVQGDALMDQLFTNANARP